MYIITDIVTWSVRMLIHYGIYIAHFPHRYHGAPLGHFKRLISEPRHIYLLYPGQIQSISIGVVSNVGRHHYTRFKALST